MTDTAVELIAEVRRQLDLQHAVFITTTRDLAAFLGVSERDAYRIKAGTDFPSRRVVEGRRTPIWIREEVIAWATGRPKEFE